MATTPGKQKWSKSNYLVGEDVSVAAYHQEWADQLKVQHSDLTDKEKPLKSLRTLWVLIFARVLEDAGVYNKRNRDKHPLCALLVRVRILPD